ncbi:hypothetical protein [Erythrobacter aurantius]|uniref:hypothetical protein n=1 Tax=Erythrobacter aurantius TaxID=2909249 RepID=UPI0020798C05|nr:hypothetical protein [Erythrobacter aurantius]
MKLSGHEGSSPNRLSEQKEVAENELGQGLLSPVTLSSRIKRLNGKGTNVRFSGYWVSSDQGKVEVSAGEFDETDLSAHSDWQEAWQNEDPEIAHGFIDPLSMLHDVSKRVVGEIEAAELAKAVAHFRSGAPFPVNDLQDLAMLIQLLMPKALPKPPKNTPSPA